MTALDLDRWRRETGVVDGLVDALLAGDRRAAASVVAGLGDDDEAHARVWRRATLLVLWHDVNGRD